MIDARPFDVLVVGDLFTELVMSSFDSWPPNPGEEAFAEKFCREVGGGAAITACGLAKLNLKVGVGGVVGETDSQWLLKRLDDAGLNTSGIHRSSREPTAVTVSVSGPHDRTFFTHMGANRELPTVLQQFESRQEFSKARHVHLACAPDPAHVINLFQSLAVQGCSLSADVGWHPDWLSDARCREALRHTDIFFPNKREATLMTGESEPTRILEALQKMGLKKVALKLGPSGAALLCDERMMFCEPVEVASVDTTGAGDCFDAGFLYAWRRGEDPQSCLKTGVFCGAMSTRCLGGIAGFPTLAQLEQQR
jgi:sugar/nucleoside kinase (ribokinase family)